MNAKERGWKVGDIFKVKKDVSTMFYKKGDIVQLVRDDGSDSPWFDNITKNENKVAICLGSLKPYVSEVERDNVHSPSHYQILPGVEVYDVREAILSKTEGLHPCEVDDWSRAWEYLTRMWGKNGLEDAKKAKWYLEKLIQRMENDN